MLNFVNVHKSTDIYYRGY